MTISEETKCKIRQDEEENMGRGVKQEIRQSKRISTAVRRVACILMVSGSLLVMTACGAVGIRGYVFFCMVYNFFLFGKRLVISKIWEQF